MAEFESVPFWSGEKLLQRGEAIISGFDPQRVDCNSYRLLVGEEYYSTSDAQRPSWRRSKKKRLAAKESFTIAPGQFGFLLTKETIKVPADAMAFISMRSGVKFRGLINVSGFHVDPGYEGKLVFSVFNAGPSNIHLSEGDELFLIWFAGLDRMSKKVRTKDGYTSIPNELINGMSRELVSLPSLASDMSGMKVTLRVHAIIFGTTAVAFLAFLLAGIGFLWQQGLLAYVRNPPVAVESLAPSPPSLAGLTNPRTLPPDSAPTNSQTAPPTKTPPGAPAAP